MNKKLNWYTLQSVRVKGRDVPSVRAATLPNHDILTVGLHDKDTNSYSLHLDGYAEVIGICISWDEAQKAAVKAAIAMLRRKRDALDRLIAALEEDK